MTYSTKQFTVTYDHLYIILEKPELQDTLLTMTKYKVRNIEL